MDEAVKERDTYQMQLTTFQHLYEELQQEKKSLIDEVNQNYVCFFSSEHIF